MVKILYWGHLIKVEVRRVSGIWQWAWISRDYSGFGKTPEIYFEAVVNKVRSSGELLISIGEAGRSSGELLESIGEVGRSSGELLISNGEVGRSISELLMSIGELLLASIA